MARPDAGDRPEEILYSVFRLQVLDEADDDRGMAPRRRTRTGYRLELVEVDSPRIDRDAGGAEAGVTAGRGRQETGRGEDGVCASQDQGFQDSDFPPLHGQAFLTEDV